MAKRYYLDSVTYPTQKAAKAECDRIRTLAPHYVPLIGKDRQFVLDLLALHHDYNAKVGAGIEHVYGAVDGQGTNPCFYVRRIDGSSIDFSALTCLKQKKTPFEQRLRAALREVVQFHSAMYKRDHFEAAALAAIDVRCAITNEIVQSRQDAQADHHPTSFFSIVELFKVHAEEKGIMISETSIAEHPDSGTKLWVVCDDLRNAFIDYHKKVVVDGNYRGFRLVQKDAHLRNSNLGSKRMTGTHKLLYG